MGVLIIRILLFRVLHYIYIGVLIIRILLFRVLHYIGSPIFGTPPHFGVLLDWGGGFGGVLAGFLEGFL